MSTKNEIAEIAEIVRQIPLKEIETVEFNSIVKAFQSSRFVYSDCPDGYYINESNECIIFEHFEIDAAKKSKKGSALKSKQAEAGRAFASEIKEAGDVCQFDFTLKDGESIDFLFDCFKTNYLNHYKKIELYKKNILQRNPHIKDFKICFVIVQLFSFGLIGYREDEPNRFSYVLFQTLTEVNDILKEYPVDYMLNIVHMPLTNGAIGLREIQLSDGRQAFAADDPHVWYPEISFQTIQNIIDYKHSKSIAEFKQDRNFIPGQQFYHVAARRKK